ncbi:MAG TPA: DUF1257 domain-containing protein [Candidatus Tectomicrobia bacterium]|nr:DUF1257 domain-containing protein [Candidatus Tectomicrobia bacterium]
MSHTATVQVQFRDRDALADACRELGFALEHGSVTFYDQQTYSGDVIHLPGWQYPIVVETPETVRMDHYEGRWGDIAQFHRLKRTYAVHASIRAVQRTGRRVLQRIEQNGHVQLVVQ